MEAPGPLHQPSVAAGPSTSGRRLLLVVLIALIVGGALRLSGIDQIGLKGSDNTYYTNMAKLWSDGHHVYSIGDSPALYHRPVVFSVYGLAIRLLGFNDASIKIVNAFLDTIDILLVFLLAFIVSRRDLRPATSAAVIYSVLPFTVLISRNELTHILSTSTLLIALILLSLAWFAEKRAARLTLALLSGVATGLSALTHEEMVFAAAAPLIYLVLRPERDPPGMRGRLIAAAGNAGSYLLGLLLVAHGMLQTHQADAQVRAAGIVSYRISESHYLRFVERPLKFGWNALTGTGSVTMACLAIALVLLLVIRFAVRRKKNRTGWRIPTPLIEDLPIWTVVTYLLLYSFFFIYYAARLFVPLIPLVIVWLMVRAASLSTQHLGRGASNLILAVITTVVVITNLGHISTIQDFVSSRFPTWTPFSLAADLDPAAGWSELRGSLTRTSWARKRFEELGHAVTQDARLLVGPSTFHPFPGRRLLQIGYYFGDNAVYLYDHDQPLDRLIREERIGFVMFTTHQVDDRPATEWTQGRRYRYQGRWSPLETFVLGENVGFGYGEYTILGEYERVRADMSRRGARIILGRRDLLSKTPSDTDPISYVVWVLNPKHWPPLEHEIRITSKSLELASKGRTDEALTGLEEGENQTDDWGRFRLRLTAARILAEHERPADAGERINEAMALMPRNTIVATALSETFPTQVEMQETFDLFTDLATVEPTNRALQDLLLNLALNLAEFALDAGDPEPTVAAFQAIEDHLLIGGSRKVSTAVAEWCAAMGRDLARDGRPAEAEAAFAAASAFSP